jgi:hypothetical protein
MGHMLKQSRKFVETIWKLLSLVILVGGVVFCASSKVIAQETPDSLAALWIDAIKDHSTLKIMPLVHPLCSEKSIPLGLLERMVDGDIPADVTINTSNLGSKEQLAKVFEIVPDKQLNLVYVSLTDQDKEKYGLGKGFPIAQHNAKWFFVICTK